MSATFSASSGSPSVSDVLATRAHSGDPPPFLTGAVSLAAHVGLIAVLAFMAHPRRRPDFLLTALPVRVVSPSALQRPGTAPAPAQPVPQPAAPAAPAEKARPVIEKAREAPRPSEKAMPAPEASKKRKPEPPAPAARRAPGGTASPSLDLPSAGDPSANGTATGLSFGAAVSNFDSDFPFAYYVEQLQSLIGANWLKPDVPPGTSCQVSFRVLRSGQVTDVRVEAPSPLPYYDRAATRALYAANPLPPLPPEFRGDSLGVHIRFQ